MPKKTNKVSQIDSIRDDLDHPSVIDRHFQIIFPDLWHDLCSDLVSSSSLASVQTEK